MVDLALSLGALLWIACPVLGYELARERGRGVLGAWLGALFGPLGIISALLLARTPEAQARYDIEVARAHARMMRAERVREQGTGNREPGTG